MPKCWWLLLGLCLVPAGLRAQENPALAQHSAAQATDDAQLQQQIQRLISELGDPDFFVRQRAQDKLAEIGAEAFDALAEAQGNDDLEIASRATFLLYSIEVNWEADSDDPEVKRLLKDYSSLDEASRLERVQQLASMGSRALPALCRLARFERSERLSKRVALEIIAQKLPGEEDPEQRSAAILGVIKQSRRTAVNWLRSYVRARRGERAAAADAWKQFTAAEIELYDEGQKQTSAPIVQGMLRYQVELLEGLDRGEDVASSLRKLLDFEEGTVDSLIDLLGWLEKHEGWELLDDVERRFADAFNEDPLLVYALASARESQGRDDLAEQAAARALAMNAGDARLHLIVAFALRNQGEFKWSVGEFRRVTELLPPEHQYALQARFLLAEMLHDRLQELEAARVLEQAVAGMKLNVERNQPERNLSRETAGVVARMHFFYAMHHAGRDRAKHIEHLDKAVTADPTEADALIALYRLADPAPQRQAKTRQLVRAAVAEFRRQIKQSPENASPYNQLAWLVGNTEGDFREALEASKKSLQLKPGTAAYEDTLGRCYYALGDLENAIKWQSRAVAGEPYSAQMQRQLDLFQKALAEKTKQP